VTVTGQVEAAAASRRPALGITDCDVHTMLPSKETLKQYFARRWDMGYDQLPRRAIPEMGLWPQATYNRRDTWPEAGVPGSDLGLLREQLLDRFDVRRAVLSSLEILLWPQQGALSSALHAALNDWMVDAWLERDDRLYGAIAVPIEDGVLAAREIERSAVHERFVTVLLTVATRDPLGHSKYWPIYEAASEAGLPVAVHIGGFSGIEGASGYWTYAAERQAGWPLAYAAQTVSLVGSGVFERFPKLQVVFQEGAVGWLPPVMWRLDRAWESLNGRLVEIERRPSDTIRDHVWLTTQPLDDPERPEHLAQLFDRLGMNDRILFATDYPHWDFDDPTRVLPASTVGAELRERIMSTNADGAFRFAAR
jgi:predicted TIM-barrel fold metal-dependent hydrolase